jgi:hypothetical protein
VTATMLPDNTASLGFNLRCDIGDTEATAEISLSN